MNTLDCDQAYVQLDGSLGMAGAILGGKQKKRGIKCITAQAWSKSNFCRPSQVPISGVKISKRAARPAPAAALGA
eukprot:881432-Pelagomonas_calceolata.AAC.6